MIKATTNTPDMLEEFLRVGGHGATVEGHEPGIRRTASVRGVRPKSAQLEIEKGMAREKGGTGIRYRGIDETARIA
ncbi:MAG: hypothetical protein ACHQX3_04200 [Nitrospirales bacterium]